MKKIAMTAFASAFMLGLAACGSADDASEDAMADNVEMPADEALAGAGDPVADADLDAAADAEMDANEATASEAADAAEAAVADVNAAAEAATQDAEDSM
jgi:hypothetical protein